MTWTAHTLPGEQYTEEEYHEMQELIHDAAVAEDYFILEELEEYAYARAAVRSGLPC